MCGEILYGDYLVCNIIPMLRSKYGVWVGWWKLSWFQSANNLIYACELAADIEGGKITVIVMACFNFCW
jgi:hypothetical protein